MKTKVAEILKANDLDFTIQKQMLFAGNGRKTPYFGLSQGTVEQIKAGQA